MKLIQWLIKVFFGSKKSDKKIREIFFNLVETNKGSITALDLAMSANLSGTDAKKFLEQFAVEFDASFEVTEQGHMVYLFPIRNQPNKKSDLRKFQTNSSIPYKKTKSIDKNNATLKNHQGSSQIASSNDQNHNTNKGKLDRSQTINKSTKSSSIDESSSPTDIAKEVENIENNITKKVENIENDLKNLGQSLNNLFKF